MLWRTGKDMLWHTGKDMLWHTGKDMLWHTGKDMLWHTGKDTLHIANPVLQNHDQPTKRQISYDVAKTFDVLGWFAPAIVMIKTLLQ